MKAIKARPTWKKRRKMIEIGEGIERNRFYKRYWIKDRKILTVNERSR